MRARGVQLFPIQSENDVGMVTQRTKSTEVAKRRALVLAADDGITKSRHRQDYRRTPPGKLLEPAGCIGDFLLHGHRATRQRLEGVDDGEIEAKMLGEEVRHALDARVPEILDEQRSTAQRNGGCGDATVGDVVQSTAPEIIDANPTLNGQGALHYTGRRHLTGEIGSGLAGRRGPHGHGQRER
jgi:hypothetical protein